MYKYSTYNYSLSMQLATVDASRDEPLGVTLERDSHGRVRVAFAHPSDLVAQSGLAEGDILVSIDNQLDATAPQHFAAHAAEACK